MNEGWIKLHRSLLEWEWFTDSNTFHVFIYLLLKANTKDLKYKGFVVSRGSLVVTISDIGVTLGLSYKAVRTAFEHLKQSEQITTRATNKFTIITICNYDSYQVRESAEGQTKGEQRAKKGQTRGEQRASIEEEEKNKRKDIIQDNISLEGEQNLPILPTNQGEKGKKKRDLMAAAVDFMLKVAQFCGVYPDEMLEAFWKYWSEPNKSGTKMRFEMQATWSLAGRLATWAKNEEKFSQNRGSRGTWSQAVKNDSKSTLDALVGNS